VFNNDVRISFIILQVDVVSGLELFDQGVFQQKSILFGADDGKLDMVNVFYQSPGLVVIMKLDEIGADPLAEALGFSYVNKFSFFAVILVNTGLKGYSM
jgi:hypothetical protein